MHCYRGPVGPRLLVSRAGPAPRHIMHHHQAGWQRVTVLMNSQQQLNPHVEAAVMATAADDAAAKALKAKQSAGGKKGAAIRGHRFLDAAREQLPPEATQEEVQQRANVMQSAAAAATTGRAYLDAARAQLGPEATQEEVQALANRMHGSAAASAGSRLRSSHEFKYVALHKLGCPQVLLYCSLVDGHKAKVTAFACWPKELMEDAAAFADLVVCVFGRPGQVLNWNSQGVFHNPDVKLPRGIEDLKKVQTRFLAEARERVARGKGGKGLQALVALLDTDERVQECWVKMYGEVGRGR